MGNDDPSRRSSRRLFETAYTKSPYKHTVIGYRDIFDQLDRNSINEYYQNRYAPNNCFFVVSGDIEKDNVLSLINDKYMPKFTVCAMNLLFVIKIRADALDPDRLEPGIFKEF